jgi:hypothetical protein
MIAAPFFCANCCKASIDFSPDASWSYTKARLSLPTGKAGAQFELREPEKPAANSSTPAYVFSDPNYGLTLTPKSAAAPEPLANVPATGKVIEHGGGYWQWDGQEWNPVPRAVPVGRKL